MTNTQDKKDEMAQKPAETQEEIKKADDAKKDVSYKAESKDKK